LLTEAEWEFAARGGKKSVEFKYSGGNKIKDVAWFKDNSYGETKPVGLKYPNELGIFDMSGNIHEWVADNLHGTYIGAPKDGFVWLADGVSAHIIRGGGWNYSAQLCRVSARSYFDRALKGEDYGFRLCLSLK
jgi:sulfatase modifying factor 1